jgi:hypothetical protein
MDRFYDILGIFQHMRAFDFSYHVIYLYSDTAGLHIFIHESEDYIIQVRAPRDDFVDSQVSVNRKPQTFISRVL